MVSTWELIEQEVKNKLSKKENTMTDTNSTPSNTESSQSYSSIEQYTESTGKRFRMLKEQKERGLTREQAYAETYLNAPRSILDISNTGSEQEIIDNLDSQGGSLE